MKACKESAVQALEKLRKVWGQLLPSEREEHAADLEYLEQFILAASKRLPTAASFARDAERRRAKN